jgi:dihydroflavonol-4-reductase
LARTAFVTGATGFVGLNLIQELLDQGWTVVALHRRSSDARLLQGRAGVECVVGDVTDRNSLKDKIPRQVDCVFHTAGNTSLWERSHAEQLRVNVKGTRNVLRAALEAGARRFIHTSSIVAYGLHSGTISEETPTRGTVSPINYVRSKALAEREVRKAAHLGLKVITFNPAHMMGPFDTRNWSRLFRLVQQGRLPIVPTGGGSFAHVGEVARCMVIAAERGRPGHNYLFGGSQVSYLGLVRQVGELLGVRRRSVVAPKALLQAYARVEEWVAPLFGREPDITRDSIELLSENFYCSSRKAETDLGYRPQRIETMLKDSHRWLREQNLI